MQATSLKSSFNEISKNCHYSITGLHESVVTYIENKKNNSLMTIIMTTNTMTMTAILILPLLYQSYGIISCSLVIIVSAYIQYKTCSLILTHFDGNQDDLSLIIARIMGIRWKLAFNIAILIVQLSVLLIYYLLACNVIFPIIVTCLGNKNYQKEKSHLTFNEFSFQYSALIASVLAIITINIKNIQLIIKLGNIGFITLIVFLIFIIYTTINNFSGSNSKFSHSDDINIIKPNIIYIAGASSIIHPSAPAIFKQSKNQSKNQRDLAISYLIAILLNILFGLFGYLGIFQNNVKNGSTANTVMDYYTGVYTLIVCFLFIAKLSTGIPIIFYIACQQLFSIINSNNDAKPPTFLQRQMFNIFVLTIITVCGIFNVDLTIAISISGAILGYIIGYLIPVLMHLKCIYGILPWEKLPQNYEQMIDSDTGILKINYSPMHLTDQTSCLIVESENSQEPIENNQTYKKCYCRHEDVVKISRGWRYTFFAIILLIGLAEICAQFYQIAQEIQK